VSKSIPEEGMERYLDDYEYYQSLFDPMRSDRQARRKRRPRQQPQKAPERWEVASELGEVAGLEGGFETTYQPGRYEEGWLLSSLRTFYDEALITDVLAMVKGGKEASVYCCEAHPSTGIDLIAAKVYRPRALRNLRNDRMYREGRDILIAPGHTVHDHEHRIMRAIDHKTTFGQQVRHTSWLMHEFTTLETLFKAGAAVPRPLSYSDNAVLMTYIGDARENAPTLHQVRLGKEEARGLFAKIMHNVELMLQHQLVHGDLSAYNVLYWQGDVTLIDFPQVINYHTNRDAFPILRRDIQRLCEYFARQGVDCDDQAIADDLWQRYARPDPRIVAAETYEMILAQLEEEKG
jgi:RIO kinase 1